MHFSNIQTLAQPSYQLPVHTARHTRVNNSRICRFSIDTHINTWKYLYVYWRTYTWKYMKSHTVCVYMHTLTHYVDERIMMNKGNAGQAHTALCTSKLATVYEVRPS